jgi:hypothetical protein
MRKGYKCLSCPNFDLCKSCYSQVHEIHPSHVFLEARSEAESNGHINEPVHPAAEPCECDLRSAGAYVRVLTLFGPQHSVMVSNVRSK